MLESFFLLGKPEDSPTGLDVTNNNKSYMFVAPLNRRCIGLGNRGSPSFSALHEQIEQLGELGLPRMRSGRKENQYSYIYICILLVVVVVMLSHFSICRNTHIYMYTCIYNTKLTSHS